MVYELLDVIKSFETDIFMHYTSIPMLKFTKKPHYKMFDKFLTKQKGYFEKFMFKQSND